MLLKKEMILREANMVFACKKSILEGKEINGTK